MYTYLQWNASLQWEEKCCHTKFVSFLDEITNLAAQNSSIDRYTLASKKLLTQKTSVLLHSDEISISPSESQLNTF